jgi:predicted RNA-binding protein with PIN domain
MAEPPEQDPHGAPPALAALPAISLWLVDGFNVLHAHLLKGRDRKDWWSAGRRQLVIDQAARLAACGVRVCVVFDGKRPADEAEPPEDALLRVVFAEDADDWMLKTMRAAADPGGVAIVTGDRPVKDRARRWGAHAVSPREWLARCAAARSAAATARESEPEPRSG